ncbi:MAG: NosD domain-containing protein [Candidatus Bathyarchaeia archaeon]
MVPDDYPTIQEAIDAASPGDTIFVKAGTYYENVVVDKPVSLEGECMQNTIIDGKSAGIVVKIVANGVNVTGFTVRKSGYPQCGFLLYYVSGCSITGNIVTANDHGGILLYSSSNNSISGNIVTANNENGVVLSDSSNYNVISGNIIANNHRGIYLSRSSNNDIFENNITNNDYCVRLDYTSNNKFYHNNFIDNTQQIYVYMTGYASLWDHGYPFGGNHWSNYNGADLYSGIYRNETGSDGIGDVPYTLDSYNKDNYPLIAPFNKFEVGTWHGEACIVGIISNSSVFNFQIDTYRRTISFNVAGLEGEIGFCRIIIPNIIVEDLWHGNYTVLLNGKPWPFKNWTDIENITYTFLTPTLNNR